MTNEIPAELEAWRDAHRLKPSAYPTHRAVIVSAGAVDMYEFRGVDSRFSAHFDSVREALAAIGSGTLALKPSREPKRARPAGPALGCEPFWRY